MLAGGPIPGVVRKRSQADRQAVREAAAHYPDGAPPRSLKRNRHAWGRSDERFATQAIVRSPTGPEDECKGGARGALSRPSDFGFERVTLGVLDRVDGQIDVEVGPTKVSRRRPLKAEDRLDRGALEPREIFEPQEQLASVEQQPEAVLGKFVTSSVEVLVPGISNLLLVIHDQL